MILINGNNSIMLQRVFAAEPVYSSERRLPPVGTKQTKHSH